MVTVRGLNVERLEKFVEENGEDIENYLPQIFLEGIIFDRWIKTNMGVEISTDVYAKLPLLDNLRRNNYKSLDLL